MSRPAVSVVLPTFNNEATLGRALASILLQDGCDFEVLAVDDCSTDRTPEVLAAFAAHDPRLRVIRTQANSGEGFARTLGIQHAAAELIAAQDGDDLSLPDRLRLQSEGLQGRPDIHWLATWGYTMTPTGHWVSAVRTATEPRQIKTRLINGQMAVIGASMMARREAVLSCGGYRSVPTPDFDLARRFVTRYSMAALPTCLYAYVPASAANQPLRYRANMRLLLAQHQELGGRGTTIKFWLQLAWIGLQGYVPFTYPIIRRVRHILSRARSVPPPGWYADWLDQLQEYERRVIR